MTGEKLASDDTSANDKAEIETGDTNHLTLWISLMASALCAMALILKKKREEQQ